MSAMSVGAPVSGSADARCPMGAGSAGRRSRADLVARRLLRIAERPPGATDAQAYAAFRKSMLLSGTRCLLTYIVFPFVLPAVGLAAGVGPQLGILIGTVAIISDVFTVRRFHAVEHRWRWPVTAVAGCVIVLLGYLLVDDWVNLLT